MKKALSVLMVVAMFACMAAGMTVSASADGAFKIGSSGPLTGGAAIYGKFDFNTSILVLVFVVLGGLGNIWGSIIATVVLYVLPEALRGFSSYRMLIYAIVLIVVMLTTNNPVLKSYFSRWQRAGSKAEGKERTADARHGTRPDVRPEAPDPG